MLRILFVPFREPQANSTDRPGVEYHNKNLGWRKNVAIKRGLMEAGEVVGVISLFYTGNVIPILMGIDDQETQIYIRGHGKPGFAGLFDHQTNDEDGKAVTPATMNQDLKFALDQPKLYFSLTAEEVANRLTHSGLRRTFRGAIKCYNCHSAESKLGFALNFAQAMYAKGYEACSVYGYRGQLSSMGHTKDVPDSRKDNQRGMHKESVFEGIADRASNRRICVKASGQPAIWPDA